MSSNYYFPGVDKVFLFQRAGTTDDPYLPLSQTSQVKYGKVELAEIPNFQEKVTVISSSGTTLTEVTTAEVLENQFRVDYSTGVVTFNSTQEEQIFTFSFLGMGRVNFPASRITIDTVDNNEAELSIQQLLDAQGNIGERLTGAQEAIGNIETLVTQNQVVKNTDFETYKSTTEDVLTEKSIQIGTLSSLQTSDQTSLVNAVNDTVTRITETKDNINTREFNVKFPFGTNVPYAKGDGSDDTAAILGAINYMQSTGGGKVKIPDGTYYCKGFVLNPKTWVDYNKVTIEGVNTHGTEIICDDNSNSVLIDFGGYYKGTDRIQTTYINIRNVKFTCTATTKNIRAFNYNVAQYCNLENVWIEGFKDGAIHFTDSYDCNFSNVHIVKCGRANSDTDYAYPLGFYGKNDCSNALFFDSLCRIEFSPLFCEFDHGARHIYFDNCKFEKMALNLTTKARPFNFLSYREIGFINCMFVNSDHYLADSASLITGTTTAGSNTMTVNQIKGGYKTIAVGDFINISGVTGVKRIISINGLTVNLDSNVDNSVANATVVGNYYIADQGKDYFNFSSSLYYDGYDVNSNLIKSAKFTNCHFGCPSKTSTRWGRIQYAEFENVTFNNCEGGAVVDRCFNIYDEVIMKNVKMASYNDAKLFNIYGKNINLDIENVKVASGTLSLITVRTGADNNNIRIGSIIGANLAIPVQADASFYFDTVNSKYFYLKNNKIKLLSYSIPIDNDNKPSAWMDADIVECTTTYPIEYVNFGHNGKIVTLVYTGTGASVAYNSSYMVTKNKANKTLATGDTIQLICHNGTWREI